ncbi:Crp/Fnr family transcriptional regulator [Sphingobacterium sp. 1.A.5]|jgi:CRP-like cAMP-binding protein|uniref:Crp/Fnr family transcriptional regulator n=1 Tax=Sphingobacterium sp. 1.A.5 TaxID=2044604 RepID=UPI000C0BEC43|nr:Crp/Fnr family transcriptional regulator [Sphingobacterium sp. 1.A.5]
MEKLKSILRFGAILSESDIEEIASNFKAKSLNATEHVLEVGQIAHEIAFIESGIVRIYKPDDDGNEVTKYFFKENQFFVDLESYYSGTAASEAFQAVVDSQLYTIHKLKIDKLCENIPNFFIFLKSITEATLLNKIKDNDFLNFGSSKTKYLEFIKRYPKLALQVPQQYIASYLKVTPQSLSRIRRELTK